MIKALLQDIYLGQGGGEFTNVSNTNFLALLEFISNIDDVAVKKELVTNILGFSTNKIPSEYAVSTIVKDLKKALDEKPNKADVAIGMISKGSVVKKSDLPIPATKGDAYFVEETGFMHQYDGEKWNQTIFTAPPSDVVTKTSLTKKLGDAKDLAPSEIAVSSHFTGLGLYDNTNSLISDSSKFDANTELITDANGKGVGAGDFAIRYPLDVNNHVSKEDNKFIISLNTSGGHNPAIWLLNTIDSRFRGLTLSISFTVRKISGDTNSLYVNLNNATEQITKIDLDVTEQIINKDIVFGEMYEDNRLMLFLFNEALSQNLVFEISNLELRLKDGIIQESKQNTQVLQTLGEYTSNVISDNSLLNANTELITDANGKGAGAGDFAIRYSLDANNEIKKLEDSFSVSINDTGGNNPAFWLINKLASEYKGRSFRVTFEIKRLGGNVDNLSILLNGSATQTLSIPLSYQYETIVETLVFGETYQDNRLMFFIPSPKDSGLNSKFEIKNISLVDTTATLASDFRAFKVVEEKKSENTAKRLNTIEQTKGVNLTLPNFLAKIGSILFDNTGVANIALFGDSWTHGVGTNGEGLINYSKYLTRMLWKQYGYAGLGWFDFGRANGTDMESADDEKTTFTKEGNFQYVDKTANAKGLPIAHTVMGIGTKYTIVIDAETPTDKINILFAKDASFDVSINGGASIQVTANSVDNWQSHLIEDNITSITLTSLTDNTIIYGIDFSYGNKGVKVHKLGCRGLSTRHPLAVDVDNWTEGLSKLDIDVFSVLLGTNDRTLGYEPLEVANNTKAIIDNVKKVYPLIDYISICPSETASGANKYPIHDYSAQLYNMSLDNNLAFISLYYVFGTREQIEYLETFYDSVHPTKRGGYVICEFLFKMLFEYYQYKN